MPHPDFIGVVPPSIRKCFAFSGKPLRVWAKGQSPFACQNRAHSSPDPFQLVGTGPAFTGGDSGAILLIIKRGNKKAPFGGLWLTHNGSTVASEILSGFFASVPNAYLLHPVWLLVSDCPVGQSLTSKKRSDPSSERAHNDEITFADTVFL